MVKQMYALPLPGIKRDVDVEPSKMNQDQREVFQCLEEEEAADAVEDGSAGYEELEDDFLMLANEGKPALEEAKDIEKAEYENKGVMIVEDEEDEEQAALRKMREELKKRFGLGQDKPGILKTNKTFEEDGEEDYEVEEVSDVEEGQEDEVLDDDRFQDRLEREYADD